MKQQTLVCSHVGKNVASLSYSLMSPGTKYNTQGQHKPQWHSCDPCVLAIFPSRKGTIA